MSGPIGHTFMYNIIILFIVIVFAFLAGTMSYYKAFKINNRIVGSIEKFEGYNEPAKAEIERTLGTFGYRVKESGSLCPCTYKGYYFVSLTENYDYCIYVNDVNPDSGTYFTYGVLTYMNLDLPVVSALKIPVFTRTNSIYKFTLADVIGKGSSNCKGELPSGVVDSGEPTVPNGPEGTGQTGSGVRPGSGHSGSSIRPGLGGIGENSGDYRPGVCDASNNYCGKGNYTDK